MIAPALSASMLPRIAGDLVVGQALDDRGGLLRLHRRPRRGEPLLFVGRLGRAGDAGGRPAEPAAAVVGRGAGTGVACGWFCSAVICCWSCCARASASAFALRCCSSCALRSRISRLRSVIVCCCAANVSGRATTPPAFAATVQAGLSGPFAMTRCDGGHAEREPEHGDQRAAG